MRRGVVRRAPVALLAIALAAAPSTGGADDISMSAARELADEGRWPEATRRLEAARDACSPGDGGGRCRAIASFTLGYVSERRAGAEPGDRRARLVEAQRHYEAALADHPGHGPAIANLATVYRRLGETARAQALLERGLADDPRGGATLAVLLGDLHRDARRHDEALTAYRRSVDLAPESDVPRRRVVELYARLPASRLPELFRDLDGWAPRFPGVAERGYRTIMHRTYQETPAATAERALVRWAALLAQNRWISTTRLDDLPTGWRARPVADLRAYVEAPDRVPGSSWWLERPERRSVLAEVALALGETSLTQGDPQGAATRWEAGIALAPDYGEYVYGALRGEKVVRLDLQTALTSLYAEHKAFDPDGRKTRRLIADLFQGKAQAYQVNDLEAIQRHHTILGLLYARRGEWTSAQSYTNGIFQLENAIATARRRDQATGGYQALPELRALLAEGYLARNRPGDVARARATALAGAQAYLDTDQVDRARSLLGRAGLDWDRAEARERASRDDLLEIIATREAVARATGPALDPAAAAFAFGDQGPHGWLFGNPAGRGLPPDFTARQRFKTLADLARKAAEAGVAGAAADWGDAAFAIAVERVPSLTGAEDLLRLERTRVPLAERAVTEPRAARILPQAPPTGHPGKTWVLSLPSEPRATYLQIGPEITLAARVSTALRDDPSFARRGISFTVKGESVTILGDDDVTRAAAERLRQVKGVGGVRTEPRRAP